MASTPNKAKELGNSRELPLRKDWEDVKEQFMFNCVFAKFTQHEKLKKILLDTGDMFLNEHAYDSYWGDGMDGNGKNRLGVILMRVRDKLNEKV